MFTHQLNDDTSLKLLTLQDAPALFSLVDNSREHLRPWMPWCDATKEVSDSEKFIQATMTKFANHNGFEAGIWYRGEIAGVIGFHYVDWHNRKTSIGYWLGESFTGKGLVTLASKALINHAFDTYDLTRINLCAAVENKASQAVAARLGFTKEGVTRRALRVGDVFQDCVEYGLLKEEWTNRT
ncbi:GNAT family N-acetyltransferase [Shouchella lonarensis]|uniref:Ribosomal-protein-serine acetyltransferase n=1 Tax=Shouchella lonarensis TaxID=1464122 RepID=A0A1G6MPC8_9BACI|nr:GNAT family protein [Shouchella lonarensis]SDC57331.1 ribosomal-protein-serine acetyltransferase [Shouchella lonarensis]